MALPESGRAVAPFIPLAHTPMRITRQPELKIAAIARPGLFYV